MGTRALGWLVLGGISLAAGACRSSAAPDVAVTIAPEVRHQTILGWGKTTPWLPAPTLLRDQAIDRAVNDLGLNRLRFEGVGGNTMRGRSWEWLNDNDDPFEMNWAAFSTATLDARAREWLVPWKQAVEARGEPFNLYVSPSFFRGGSSGDVPPWLLADEEEYAEWASALLLRLRDVHGITADYYSICNEAGNDNAFSPPVVGRLIKAVMPRLRQQGFPTMVQFSEAVNAQVAWQYVEALRDDAAIWPWVGLLTYHWYGGDNQAAMVKLCDFALARGLPTAQTEFMDLTVDHLYDDLVLGGTSYWEVYGLGGPDYEAALTHISSTTFHGGDWYWRFRQVSHYVRPGAVRIEATSPDPALRLLAFEHDGAITLVLINTTDPQSRRVTVHGLPAGTYGTSQAVGRRSYEELGLARAGADGTLTVAAPADSVVTVYPHGDADLPPTVTEWRSQPEFLRQPDSSVELVCAATDPELDAVSVSWSVTAQPQGATVRLAEPQAPRTRADGLSAAGEYVFEARVSDGTHEVARQVLLRVFDGNQPPVPVDVHNRIPVWVTVRDGGTLLRGGAWDIEQDHLTFRWSVLSHPPGANVVLEKPAEAGCRASGLTVPGDYVFQLEVNDGAHTVPVTHTVPVYP